ncbi:MAG: LamG domain-containing protein [Acidimicrobiaceae bacterium]|nr:LamG domain-containing protein [Acidimicrobiaceae bacterium]
MSYFQGSLSQLAVYPYALTPAEILAHYAAAYADAIPVYPSIANHIVTMPNGTTLMGGHPTWTDGTFRLRWQVPAIGNGAFTVQFGSAEVEVSVNAGVLTSSVGVSGSWAVTGSAPVTPGNWYWVYLTNQGTLSSYYIVADENGAPGPTKLVSGSGVFTNRPPRPILLSVSQGPILFGGNYPQVCTVYPAVLPADWLMVNAPGWNVLEPAFCWDTTTAQSGSRSLSIQSGIIADPTWWVTQSPDEWNSIPATASTPYSFTGWIKTMGNETMGPIYQSEVLSTPGIRAYYRLDDHAATAIADLGSMGANGSGTGAMLTDQAGLIAADPNSAFLLQGGIISWPQAALGDSWSWECWFQAPTTLPLGGFYELLRWGNTRIALDENNRLDFGPLKSPNSVADGNPHHLVVSVSPTAIWMYLDGGPIGYTDLTPTPLPLTVPVTYPEVVQDIPGLAHYWRLGGGGPWQDIIGGIAATAVGAGTVTPVPGLVGDDDGAIRTTSTSGVGTASLLPAYTTWSWAFLFKIATTDMTMTSNYVLYTGASGVIGPRVYLSLDVATGRRYLYFYGTNLSGVSAYTTLWSGDKDYNDGQTHHVVVTWDGVTASLYSDGVLRQSRVAVDPNQMIMPAGRLVRMGCYTASSGQEWDGIVDEVSWWDRALDQSEVTALYQAIPKTPVDRLISGLAGDVEHDITVQAFNASGGGPAATASTAPWGALYATSVTAGYGIPGTSWLKLDEVAFYTAALTADQVGAHWVAGSSSDALGPQGAGWYEVWEWDALGNMVARHLSAGPPADALLGWGQVTVNFTTQPNATYFSIRTVLVATGTVWFDNVLVAPDVSSGAVTNVTDGVRVMGPPAMSVFHLAGNNGADVVPLFFGTYSRSQEGGPQVTTNMDVTQIPIFNLAQPITRTGAIKWRQVQFNAMFLAPEAMAQYTALRNTAYASNTPIFFRDQSGRQALVQQSPQGHQVQHEPSNYRRRYDLQNTYLEVPNTVSPYTPYAYVVGRRALLNGSLPALDLTEEV